MTEVTRPGVSEAEIYAEMMRETYRWGCDARYPFLSLQSGPANIGWGAPRWLLRAEAPRRVQRGDMVQAEIHTLYGGQEAQVQMSVALDPVDADNRKCETIARSAYEAGLKAVKPGATFARFISAMSSRSSRSIRTSSHTFRARTGRSARAWRNSRRHAVFIPKSASAMKRVHVDRSRNESRRCISSTACAGSSARHDVSRFARSMQNAQSYGHPRER